MPVFLFFTVSGTFTFVAFFATLLTETVLFFLDVIAYMIFLLSVPDENRFCTETVTLLSDEVLPVVFPLPVFPPVDVVVVVVVVVVVLDVVCVGDIVDVVFVPEDTFAAPPPVVYPEPFHVVPLFPAWESGSTITAPALDAPDGISTDTPDPGV